MIMEAKGFADRVEAGKALARRLVARKVQDAVVLAMPRGGVPVAAEVARVLRAPLDLVHVRKIGTPLQPELAAAAVVDGESPEIVLNEDVIEQAGVSAEYIESQAEAELQEIARRRRIYSQGHQSAALEGRTLILVDDGIATGASVRAAVKALRRKRPKELILAVPVAPSETLEALTPLVDDVVCLATPTPFYAIGLHYRDFHQVPDAEVIRILEQARTRAQARGR
ncbi:MAG: phosphoribosyltransferase family protein [Hyphomicrobium sp.]|jgi:putative phosphoribosyl transferase